MLSKPRMPVGRFMLTPDMDRYDTVVKPFKNNAHTVVVEAKYWMTRFKAMYPQDDVHHDIIE